MSRMVTGFLILLLAGPPLQADDKPKEKPSTPQEQFKALEEEWQAAQKEFQKARREAKDQQERQEQQKAYREFSSKSEKLTRRFLELAEKNPKNPVAVDALTWVVSHTNPSPPATESPRAKAIDLLMRDYISSEKIAGILGNLAQGLDKQTETFLRAAIEKSPHRNVKGQACLGLAQYLKKRESRVQDIRDQPNLVVAYERMLGKEYIQKLLKMDPKETDKQVEELLEHVVKDYSDIKQPFSNRTLGDLAKQDLFEIQHLAIGKPVPDIEGEDIDGKKFKLSDYHGKVVMLDFWGYW